MKKGVLNDWIALKITWPILASPHTSFGVRSSRIHFSRDEQTPKDVCGEARPVLVYCEACQWLKIINCGLATLHFLVRIWRDKEIAF